MTLTSRGDAWLLLAWVGFVFASPLEARPVDAAPASGRQPEPAAKAPPAIPDFASYVAEVEKIRGLAFTGPVARSRQSLDGFRGFIGKELDRELPPARAECSAHALRWLGLLPEGFDLRKAYSDLLLSQVAAYYNPASKTFYILRQDLPAEALKPTVIHELTHALQDQRFGLAARVDALRASGNEDEENAFRFLAEGEATYVMTIGALRDAGVDLDADKASLDQAVETAARLGREAIASQLRTMKGKFGREIAASTEAILSYPDFLFRLLLDPYYVGQRAVHRAYRRGGWAAVDDLWKNPPTSTELFLHPEKLGSEKRDEPVKVDVPDLSQVLGPGYAPGCENTLGEMETEMLLEATLPDDTAAAIPAGPSAGVGSAGGTGSEPTAAARAAAGPDGSRPGGVPPRLSPQQMDPRSAARTDPRRPWVERARAAAAGWGGDRYRAFEKDGRETVVVWKTVWDTDADALEFNEAMQDAVRARMPGGSPLLVHLGREVAFVAGASAAQARAVLASLYPSLAPSSQPSPPPPPAPIVPDHAPDAGR